MFFNQKNVNAKRSNNIIIFLSLIFYIFFLESRVDSTRRRRNIVGNPLKWISATLTNRDLKVIPFLTCITLTNNDINFNYLIMSCKKKKKKRFNFYSMSAKKKTPKFYNEKTFPKLL